MHSCGQHRIGTQHWTCKRCPPPLSLFAYVEGLTVMQVLPHACRCLTCHPLHCQLLRPVPLLHKLILQHNTIQHTSHEHKRASSASPDLVGVPSLPVDAVAQHSVAAAAPCGFASTHAAAALVTTAAWYKKYATLQQLLLRCCCCKQSAKAPDAASPAYPAAPVQWQGHRRPARSVHQQAGQQHQQPSAACPCRVSQAAAAACYRAALCAAA